MLDVAFYRINTDNIMIFDEARVTSLRHHGKYFGFAFCESMCCGNRSTALRKGIVAGGLSIYLLSRTMREAVHSIDGVAETKRAKPNPKKRDEDKQGCANKAQCLLW